MNIEPEKELNDDDLFKIIEETDRPAWHFTLQKAAKAEYNQKQNWKFHQILKQLARKLFNERNLINRRVTQSMARQEKFNQQQKNLIKIEAIDINENSIKNLKPILIAAMYKQSHSLNKRTTKSNFLFQSKTEFYKEKKTLLSTLLIFFNKN